MRFVDIVDRFTIYYHRHDDKVNHWYIGVAVEPRKALFEEHGVNEETGRWVYEIADDAETARLVRDYFLNLGAQGPRGPVPDDHLCVFSYLKPPQTHP